MNLRSFRQIFRFSRGLALGLCLTGAAAAQEGKIVGFVELPDLVRSIERAITEARLVDPQAPFFIIKDIELHVNISVSEGVDGSFSIPVWFFGVEVEGDITSIETAMIEMTVSPSDTAVVGGADLVDLASLIKMLKKAFSETKMQGNSISFTRKWTLKRSAEAGVDAIIMEFGAGLSDEKSHSITYNLCQTVDLKTCVGEE